MKNTGTAPLSKSNDTIHLHIENMHCGSCVAKIEMVLVQIPGVTKSSANFADHSAMISGNVNTDTAIAALAKIGYQASEQISSHDDTEKATQEKAYLTELLWKTLVAGLVGIAFLTSEFIFQFIPRIGEAYWQISWFIVGIITLFVMIFSAGHIYKGAWKSFKARNALSITHNFFPRTIIN